MLGFLLLLIKEHIFRYFQSTRKKIVIRMKSIFIKLYLRNLRSSYYKGNSLQRNPQRGLERMSPEIIEVGNFLRENSLKIYKKKYKDRRYRILFQMPNGGVGLYWFHDLLQTLQYTGIECTWISRNTENFQTEWMDFKPSVFITMDETEVLDYLDLKFILDYKKKYSCLRLYTPISTHRFPKRVFHQMIKDDLNSRVLVNQQMLSSA